ncbi:Histone-lysine N-methyltransferase 2A [Nymphon striatum]|nr:Histone-lysine N-methyltransferase 2A [Nymphon striatum]
MSSEEKENAFDNKVLSVRYWEDYDRDLVWQQGFGHICTQNIPEAAPCFLCGSVGLEELCAKCIKCASCGKMIPGRDFEERWRSNKLCSDCHSLKQAGNLCPVCKKCYNLSDFDSQMIQCSKCKIWVHSKCDGMTDDMYKILSDLPEAVEYFCPNCLKGASKYWIEEVKFRLNSGFSRIVQLVSQIMKAEAKIEKEKSGCSMALNHTHMLKNDCDNPLELKPKISSPQSLPNESIWDSLQQFISSNELIGSLNSTKDGNCSDSEATKSADEILFDCSDMVDHDVLDLDHDSVDDIECLDNIRFKISKSRYECLELECSFPWCKRQEFTWINNTSLLSRFNSNLVKDMKINVLPHPHHNYAVQSPLVAEFAKDDISFRVRDKKNCDKRKCVLCLHVGDEFDHKSGRLLYTGQNEWIHVNCALWSAEVYEEVDGSLQNVHTAILRGKQLKCEKCEKVGATVGCCKRHCPLNYHFMCARKDRAIFQEDKKVFCMGHADCTSAEVSKATSFKVKRCVYIDLSDMFNSRMKKNWYRGLPANSVKIVSGSLVVEHLGHLTLSSDINDVLIPVNYTCVRKFWSLKNPSKKVNYTLRTVEVKGKDSSYKTVGKKINNHAGPNSHIKVTASVDKDINTGTTVADAPTNCDSTFINKNLFEDVLNNSKAINNCDKIMLNSSCDDAMNVSETNSTNVDKDFGTSETIESGKIIPLATNDSANNCDQASKSRTFSNKTDIASNLNVIKPSNASVSLVDAQHVKTNRFSPEIEKNIFAIFNHNPSFKSCVNLQSESTQKTATNCEMIDKQNSPISEKFKDLNVPKCDLNIFSSEHSTICTDKGCDTLTTSKTLNDSHILMSTAIPEDETEKSFNYKNRQEKSINNNNIIVNGWKSKAKRKQQFLIRNDFNDDTEKLPEVVLDTVKETISQPLSQSDISKWKNRYFGPLSEHRIDASKLKYFQSFIGSRFSRIRYLCKICGELYQLKSRFKKHIDTHNVFPSRDQNSRLCPVTGILLSEDCSKVDLKMKINDVPIHETDQKISEENVIGIIPTPTLMTSKLNNAIHLSNLNKQSSLPEKVADSINSHFTKRCMPAKQSFPSVNIRRPRILATPNISKLNKHPVKSAISTESPKQKLNGDLLVNHVTPSSQPSTVISNNNLVTQTNIVGQDSVVSSKGSNCPLLVPHLNQIPICLKPGIMTVKSQLSTLPIQPVAPLTLNSPSIFPSPVETMNSHKTCSLQLPSLPVHISSVPVAMPTCVPATNILSVQPASANPVIVQQNYHIPQTVPTFGVEQCNARNTMMPNINTFSYSTINSLASTGQRIMYAGSIGLAGSMVLPSVNSSVVNLSPSPDLIGSRNIVSSSVHIPSSPVFFQNNVLGTALNNQPPIIQVTDSYMLNDTSLPQVSCPLPKSAFDVPVNGNLLNSQCKNSVGSNTMTCHTFQNSVISNSVAPVLPNILEQQNPVGKAPTQLFNRISIDTSKPMEEIEKNLRRNIGQLLGSSDQVESVVSQLKALPQMAQIFKKKANNPSKPVEADKCITYKFSNSKRTFNITRKRPTSLHSRTFGLKNMKPAKFPKDCNVDSPKLIVDDDTLKSMKLQNLLTSVKKSTKSKSHRTLNPPELYVVPLSPSEQTVESETESLLLKNHLRKEENRSRLATESGFIDGILESFTPTKTHIEYIIESEEGFFVQSPSIDAAWRNLTEAVQGSKTSNGIHCYPLEVDGLKMFGLRHHCIIYLIEQLPGAELCRINRFKFHKPEQISEKEDEELVESENGCARANPYVFRTAYDMFSFLASKHRMPPELRVLKENINCKPTRRVTSSDLPNAMRFRHLRETAKEAVGVYRSPIHGRGLFCKRDIDPGEMIIEYAGEVIRSVLTDLREKLYDSKGIGCYMFRIDDYDVVDATMHGNAARFINHSCEPNCYSKVIQVDGSKHIVIFASRKIYQGEELTYNYKFPIEDVKIPCTCGTRRCRKYLN